MTAEPYYLGIDLGGTTVKAGVVSEQRHLQASFTVETANRSGQDVLERIIHSARQAVAKAGLTLKDIVAVGVASPGPIDLEAGIICDSPNIRDWRDIPLAKLLSEALGPPTVLENDANAAALGEYYCGVGQTPPVSVMAMVTLGSGIGGGIVIDGQVLHGAHGFAGEFGHVIIVAGGRKCGCGQRGCAEAYASANSTAARAAEALDQGRASSLNRLLQAGHRITAKDVVDHTRQGDGLAAEIVDSTAYYLALLSLTVRHSIDPELIVLGGGMSQAGNILLSAVRKHFKEQSWHLQGADRCRIELAALGNEAGMIGAAMAAVRALGR